MKNQKGSALVTLLIFVTTGIIVISGAVAVTLINTQGTSEFGSGEKVLQIAESGAEEAVQKIIRDYDYSGGTINIGSGQVTVSVSGAATKTIESVGSLGDYERTIQVTVEIVDDTITVVGWIETN